MRMARRRVIPAAPHRAQNDDREILRMHRLAQVMLIAGFERAQPVGEARVRGQRDRGRTTAEVGVERTDLLDQPVAVEIRHADVRDQHVRTMTQQLIQRIAAGGRHPNAGAVPLQQQAQRFERVFVVVDREDRQASERRQRRVGDRLGRLISYLVPDGGKAKKAA